MGREWDRVFDVEMDSGLKLKLALDNGENPYIVADRFLEQHDLPQEFKEQVGAWVPLGVDFHVRRVTTGMKTTQQGNRCQQSEAIQRITYSGWELKASINQARAQPMHQPQFVGLGRCTHYRRTHSRRLQRGWRGADLITYLLSASSHRPLPSLVLLCDCLSLQLSLPPLFPFCPSHPACRSCSSSFRTLAVAPSRPWAMCPSPAASVTPTQAAHPQLSHQPPTAGHSLPLQHPCPPPSQVVSVTPSLEGQAAAVVLAQAAAAASCRRVCTCCLTAPRLLRG